MVSRPEIQARAYAYADQDDVWDPDKLERARRWLDTVDPAVAALYCSRTRLIDAAGRDAGLSPLFSRPPSFANALAQNIAGGSQDPQDIVSLSQASTSFKANAAVIRTDDQLSKTLLDIKA